LPLKQYNFKNSTHILNSNSWIRLQVIARTFFLSLLDLSKRALRSSSHIITAHLEKAVEDSDALIEEEVPEELRNELIEKNLIVCGTYSRNPDLWIDELPPEKCPELGIGRHVAWQTPLYREAVKKALQGA
jgi:hypothetical protein